MAEPIALRDDCDDCDDGKFSVEEHIRWMEDSFPN